MSEPVSCDLCGKHQRELFHFTGADEYNIATGYFVPDFDDGIYCYVCLSKARLQYRKLDIPHVKAISITESKEPIFQQDT